MKVRLIKGLSYTTPSFNCRKGEEINVADEIGADLIKTGRFEEATPEESTRGDNDNSGDNKKISTESIDKMKMPELIALAEEKCIDISDCKNNEERAEKIKGALGLLDIDPLFEE